MRKKKQDVTKKRVWSPLYVVSLIVLALYAVSFVGLLSWGFMASFKDNQTDFRINIFGLPKQWKWENYVYVLKNFFMTITDADGNYVKIGIPQMAWNSIMYSVGCTSVKACTTFVVAYACARYRYKFSSVIYFIVIFVMIFPVVGTGPSGIQMARRLGLYDNIFGIYFMNCHFLGMHFLIFYGMFRAFPDGYIEAAKIDGAGNWSIFLKIVTPLCVNTLLTIFLLDFIGYWNDYTTPLIYLPSYPTISLAVWTLSTTNINSLSSVPMRMCGAMILFIPTFVLFLTMHKRFLGNLNVGGLKG